MSSFYEVTVGRENSSRRVEAPAPKPARETEPPPAVRVIARNTVEIIEPDPS
ncbi:MAG TPA: hypothetical protein VJY33_12420 [Isosphaeraceae bacterium]|nr:hypothetical protein [Isosphaeraceae bacterium]